MGEERARDHRPGHGKRVCVHALGQSTTTGKPTAWDKDPSLVHTWYVALSYARIYVTCGLGGFDGKVVVSHSLDGLREARHVRGPTEYQVLLLLCRKWDTPTPT